MADALPGSVRGASESRALKWYRSASQRGRLSCLASGLLLLCAGCATVIEEEPPSSLDPSASAGGAAGAPAGGGGSANGGSGNVGLGGSFNNGSGGGASPGGTGGRPPVGAGGSSGGSAGGATGTGGTPPVVDTTPQFPSGTLLLEEDFEDDPTEWIPSNGSVWATTTDPEAEGNVYAQTETNPSTPQLLTAGDTSWRGVVAEVDFKVVSFNGSSSSYMAGLCLRVQGPETFYMVGLRSASGGGPIQLRAFGESDTNLAQSEFEGGVVGVWYHLKVEIVGNTITAYLDDALMFTHTDATIPNGGIGLCTVRASALFDNVRVTAP